MAYQNVGTPVFYVDNNLFLSANGVTPSNVGEIYNLSPGSHSVSLSLIPPGLWHYFAAYTGGNSNAGLDYSYIAVFGHNFADLGETFRFYPEPAIYNTNITNTINYQQQSSMSNNGWSLFAFDKTNTSATIWAGYLEGQVPSDPINLKISSLSIGTHYTMPHSPDLSLTLTRDYSGIKTIETKGGASLSNTFYTKPPAWGDNLGAWELGSNATNDDLMPSPKLSKSGRRVWNLSFSYLQDSTVFPEVSSQTSYETYDYTEGGATPYSTYGSNVDEWSLLNPHGATPYNFYAEVIHKTNGGQLPFIFQPDGSNNNPDQFAICKFDMNSFKFDQVANSVYNCKIKIREVW